MKIKPIRFAALAILAGCAASRVDLGRWDGPPISCPLAVIDAAGPQATDDDLDRWESQHGRVPDHALVIFHAKSIAPPLAGRIETCRLWKAWICRERLEGSPPALADAIVEEGRLFARPRPAPAIRRGGTARFIEFGWDIPDAAYLRAHAADMDRAPFDGVVLDPTVAGKRFSWIAFGRERLAEDALAASLADLRATHLEHLKSNFLRLNVTPGDAPWDGDWSAILSNARVAGRFVREAGLRGLLFDTEPYERPLFRKGNLEDARRRGREFAAAYGAEAPDSTILFTFAHTVAALRDYALLGPFLDGMLEGAPPSVEFVDGFENSYSFKSAEAFARGREQIRKAEELSAVPEIYRRRMKVGFGLWMDYESGRRPWPDKAFFAPDEFERALRAASAASDGWVWIYTERLNWWTGEHLPLEYRAAVERARR